MLKLYGLTVDVVEGVPDDVPRGAADLRWRRIGSDAIPARSPGEGWAWRAFIGEDDVACSFAVSPDGREIVSHATPAVREAGLFGLFAEAVMRTVLRRLGAVSFHGATLSADDRAVMLLGGKRAGKSSLAAALVLAGWSPVSDDLSRVVEGADGWRVPAGYRRGKLHSDAATALGFDPERLSRRWTSGASPDAPGNKWMLPEADAAPPEAPLAAIYVLGDRRVGAAPLSVAPLAPIERVAELLSHFSDDPLDAPASPPAAAKAMVLAIARGVPVLRLSLADDLGRLPEAAEALSALHTKVERN